MLELNLHVIRNNPRDNYSDHVEILVREGGICNQDNLSNPVVVISSFIINNVNPVAVLDNKTYYYLGMIVSVRADAIFGIKENNGISAQNWTICRQKGSDIPQQNLLSKHVPTNVNNKFYNFIGSVIHEYHVFFVRDHTDGSEPNQSVSIETTVG